MPKIDGWTESMDIIPRKYSYTSIVEYLIKRRIQLVRLSNTDQDAEFMLPTADKPLVKGYNFFASGQVVEILLNATSSMVHVRTTVLASMRDYRYDVKCVLDKTTGLIIQSECKCPAGAGGKCNHIAGLLFALLDFVTTMRNPDCCTSQSQVWHMPRQRKSKKSTESMVVGQRQVEKHIYGKERSRKRPLESYSTYRAIPKVALPNKDCLLRDLKELQSSQHAIGLMQVLEDSSEDSSQEDEDEENVTPEELVMKRLKVTSEEAKTIERETVGQNKNPVWFRQRYGRITAGGNRALCWQETPDLWLVPAYYLATLPHVAIE